MSVDYDETMVLDQTSVENDKLSWWEAFVLWGTDLPALSERINELTEEVDNLF